MNKTKYFKRVVNGITTELHYHEDRGDYMKGKSYPENVDSFNENELEELELDEWLDEGLRIGVFNDEVLCPKESTLLSS